MPTPDINPNALPAIPQFTTTHWSVVLAAKDDTSAAAADALAQLCRTYWYPLYAFIRRRGHNPHDAQDLTQEFFYRLLDKRYLSAVDHRKGRFRTFLLTALKRFMANEWDRQHAQKRGGFVTVVSIDQETAEDKIKAYQDKRNAGPAFRHAHQHCAVDHYKDGK